MKSIKLPVMCSEERRSTWHSIVETDDVQTITCTSCLHPHEHLFEIKYDGKRVNIPIKVHEEYQKNG